MALGALEVLVIDDEKSVLNVMKIDLEQEGHHVTAVETCEEGLEIYRTNPTKYDLIFTDLNQPRKTGVDLIDAVRAIDQKVPIYVMTGGADPELIQAAEDRLGKDHILYKPFMMNEVIGDITEGLQKQQEPQKPTISIFYRDFSVLDLYSATLGSDYEICAHEVDRNTEPGNIAEQVIQDNPVLVFLPVNYTRRYQSEEGLAASDALKEHSQTSAVPVICTSSNPDSYREKASGHNTNYVLDPSSPTEDLLNLVREHAL